MLLSKCAMCDSKKSRFINKHETSEFRSNWELKIPLSIIPILGDNLLEDIK